MTRPLPLFLIATASLNAASPSLTTAASLSTLLANSKTVIAWRHPKKAGGELKAKVKDVFTRGKLKTLPVPAAPIPPFQAKPPYGEINPPSKENL